MFHKEKKFLFSFNVPFLSYLTQLSKKELHISISNTLLYNPPYWLKHQCSVSVFKDETKLSWSLQGNGIAAAAYNTSINQESSTVKQKVEKIYSHQLQVLNLYIKIETIEKHSKCIQSTDSGYGNFMSIFAFQTVIYTEGALSLLLLLLQHIYFWVRLLLSCQYTIPFYLCWILRAHSA